MDRLSDRMDDLLSPSLDGELSFATAWRSDLDRSLREQGLLAPEEFLVSLEAPVDV